MKKRLNQPKNIEQFFRHQLKEYEAVSSDFLWEKLEKRIPAKPKKKAPWGVIAILIFSISLVLFTFSWSRRMNEQKIHELDKINSPIAAITPKPSKHTNSKIIKKKAEEAHGINKQKNSKQLKVNNNTKTEYLASSFNVSVTSQPISKRTNKKTIVVRSKEKSKLLEKSIKEEPLKVPQRIHPTTNNVSKTIQPISLIAQSSLKPLVLPIKKDSLPSVKKITKGGFLLGKWYAELVTAPYLWFSGKAKNTPLKLNQSLINGNKLVDYGILFRGEGEKKWSFEFGFLYGIYRFNIPINTSLQFTYLNNFLDEEDVLTGIYAIESPNLWQSSTQVAIKYAALAPPFIQDGATFDLKGALIQQTRNLRFPFGMGYHLLKKDRWSTYLNAGIHINFYSLKSTSFAQVQLSHESLQISSTPPQNSTNSKNFQTLESYLGLNVAYQLSGMTKLRLGTQFSTSLFSSYNTNTQSLKGLQVSIGLNYCIGNTHSNYQIIKN